MGVNNSRIREAAGKRDRISFNYSSAIASRSNYWCGVGDINYERLSSNAPVFVADN